MCTMDAFSNIACYSVLLLCYILAHGIQADSRNQNLLNKRQYLNRTLSTADRSRRLIPYVTYYVAGNNDDNNPQYQHQQNNHFNLNTPRPTANSLFYQNEKKPQHIVHNQHQHNYQTSNHIFQQHTTPGYLRFPSSSKFRRPIVIGTSETPYTTAQAEKTNDYYYDYIQTSPRPIIKPNTINYNHGFLPTIPPTHYTQLELSSTKPKKLKRLQPKRPLIPITTTTDKYGALNELLHGYDLGNKLSNKITAENIDSSINTLSAVLNILQKEAEVQVRPKKLKPVHRPDPIDEYDSDDGNQGRPGVDYPTLSVIPKTSFDCKTQRYKGFFGDPETKCQVWHYCDLNGGQASFLCPNGTIFNQVTLTCDWWFNVKCDTTAQLYVLNERLYKYIIPPRPSFPEDYEGPLVDKYLEDKFRETENKKSQQREQTMASILNMTTIEPDTVGTPYQQLLDVDT